MRILEFGSSNKKRWGWLARLLAATGVAVVLGAGGWGLPAHANANGVGYVRVKPRVVLISSLSFDHLPDILNFREYYANYEAKLERIVLRRFDPDEYDVRVLHRATGDQISRILQSPNNVAVFYVAHAGTAGGGRITDRDLNDVTPAFRRVHPNLRYLGIVGCESAKIIPYLRSKGYFADRPHLEVAGFEKKVDAAAGLKKVANAAASLLRRKHNRDGYDPVCESRPGWRVRIRRKVGQSSGHSHADALFVEAGDQLVAVFPPARAGAVQEATGWIDADGIRHPSQLKIVAGSGAPVGSAGTVRPLGELEISWDLPGMEGAWNRFELRGKPIGVAAHVYRYRGPAPGPETSEDRLPYVCKGILPVRERRDRWDYPTF